MPKKIAVGRAGHTITYIIDGNEAVIEHTEAGDANGDRRCGDLVSIDEARDSYRRAISLGYQRIRANK